MIIFVLICTVGINAVRAMMWFGCWRGERDMNGFLSEDIRLYWSLASWDEDVVILILPWCRRLSPVATCRCLISAEYFGCTLIKHFIFVYVFKKNLKRWLVCFLTARLTHRKNHKLPGRVTFLVARETAGSILRDDNQFCVFSDANQRKHSLDYTISSSANCFLRAFPEKKSDNIRHTFYAWLHHISHES